VAVNYLFKKPGTEAAEQASLEAELVKLQGELLAGKVRTSVSSGDVASGSQVEVSIKERIALVLRRLNQLDPDTYSAADCIRITRTRAQIYQG